MTSTHSNQTISSFTKRRQASHEPPPVTFSDHRSPSARLNRAIQSTNLNLVKRLLETHSSHPLAPKSNNKLDPRNQDPVTRKTSLILATETPSFEICKLLIEEYHVDSDVISRDLENNTVLHLAAAEGLDDIITLYHSHYPFVLDWANSEGMTALHIASQKGNESTVSLLLDFQADVELTDNEGNTSLHYAAAWGHLKIVLLLIDRGSPFWAKNNQTFTASDYAFSFSIQSALQESARAHFESKKQQRHQRQQRDRDKERKHQRNVVGSSTIMSSPHGSESSINLSRPPVTNRAAVKSPQQQQQQQQQASTTPRSNSGTPLTMANAMIPKISTSPTTLMTNASTSTSSNSGHPLTPLAPTSATPKISKPLTSPTNSISAARTVSHLISKDLVAIQDFRTKTTALTPSNNGQGNGHHQNQSASLTVQSTLAGVGAGNDLMPPVHGSRLLPLQLVGGTKASTTTAIHELRTSSSTGNLNKTTGTPTEIAKDSLDGTHVANLRNRAGSTESDNISTTIGLGYREGLSRLKYLKNNNLNLSRSIVSNHAQNEPSASSPHLLPPSTPSNQSHASLYPS